MITIDDLTGISENKRNQAIECLDDLITFKDSEGRLSPIISGYNWYIKLAKYDRIITFSNVHETETYESAMLKDLNKLGYNPNTVLEQIRDKAGAFLWNPIYRIRGDKNDVLVGLKIKDIRTGQYINLQNYIKPLSEYSEFINSKGYLLAEDQGWELNIPFNNKKELMTFVNLFLRKSGTYIYDENGVRIPETYEERILRAPWTDAYRIPVLIIGKSSLKYASELPYFDQATKIFLVENNNELSFIIHKNLDFLRNLSHYEQLKKLGFKEEICLGKKPFLKDIDEI